MIPGMAVQLVIEARCARVVPMVTMQVRNLVGHPTPPSSGERSKTDWDEDWSLK